MQRRQLLHEIQLALKNHRAVALLGPRQSGKTTLARQLLKQRRLQETHYFDLEMPEDLARLTNPFFALDSLKGLIIVDEIQKKPELFEILRVLIDKNSKKCQFLLLGSSSREIIQKSSETLAGRLGFVEVTPFSLNETHDLDKLWIRGGYPLSFLAKNNLKSYEWRRAYVQTFLERDIPNLGIQIPPPHLRRFWIMLAHYHGQRFNASELGKSLGISDHTAKKYLDILAGTFMIRVLPPWFENLGKRQVKTPKIYFRDSGLFHFLLSIESQSSLYQHPKLGASWEGFALEEVIRVLNLRSEEIFFWSSHNEAEIDLMTFFKGHKIGFEIKFNEAPKVTRSMRIAMADLKIKKIFCIYPGKSSFEIEKGIFAVPLSQLDQIKI